MWNAGFVFIVCVRNNDILWHGVLMLTVCGRVRTCSCTHFDVGKHSEFFDWFAFGSITVFIRLLATWQVLPDKRESYA